MDCPVCNSAMVVLELDSVEIDYCMGCEGIWLDAGELELLLEGAQGKDDVLRSFTVDANNHEKKRRCPICLKKMDKVWCGKDEKVLIDKCRSNDGIWFDNRELYDVISMGSFDEHNKVLIVVSRHRKLGIKNL